MKETLKVDGKNKVSNEFFDFHEKVNTILEEQEEIFATHMAAIKVGYCEFVLLLLLWRFRCYINYIYLSRKMLSY